MVLTNLLRLQSNPFLALWWDATRTAGARVERLGGRSLGRCAVRGERFWIHLHFPERYATDARLPRAVLRVLKLAVLLVAARALRAGVITTMHNARSHESRRPFLEAIVWSAVARATTDVHFLSSAGAAEVLEQHPALRSARPHVIPHGNYRPVLGELESRAAARERLGLAGASRCSCSTGGCGRTRAPTSCSTRSGRSPIRARASCWPARSPIPPTRRDCATAPSQIPACT